LRAVGLVATLDALPSARDAEAVGVVAAAPAVDASGGAAAAEPRAAFKAGDGETRLPPLTCGGSGFVAKSHTHAVLCAPRARRRCAMARRTRLAWIMI
jgi:hypothetical protein